MMADKQGLLGARSTESDDHGSHGREDREAYEEDWYRSLRALAERQQHLLGPDGELKDEGEPDPDESGADEAVEPPPVPEARSEPEPHLRVVPQPVDDEPEGPDPLDHVSDLEGMPAPAGVPAPDEGRYESAEESPAQDASGAGLADGARHVSAVEAAEAELEAAVEPEAPQIEEIGAQPEPEPEPKSELEAEPVPEPETVPEAEPEPEPEAGVEADVEAEAGAGAAGPSLSSIDPMERRVALEELASRELSDADTHRVEALLLDPEAEIRRLALHTLAARPDRVQGDAIWQALQDPSDDVRSVAVELAAGRGDVPAIAPLLAARDWPLTQQAVLRLLPDLVAAAPVDDSALRQVLGSIGDLDPGPRDEEEPALGRLALALGSRRILDALSWPDVPRLGAIRLLVHDRSPAVLRELASHEGDPIDEIRELAAAATRELAAGAARELAEAEAARERMASAAQPPEEGTDRIMSLARALLDDDPTVRHLALSGLGGMDRSAIAAWVREAVGNGDAGQLSLAASTAQTLRLVESAADILDAAAQLPVDARHALMISLQSFVMPPVQLAGLLSQVREEVRAEAIGMLWQVGGPPLLTHLRPYLDDHSVPVRLAVLDVFAESGVAAATDVSRIALESDVSPMVRARAVRMLAQVAPAPTVATVVRALSDPDPEVRATAIETLPDIDGAEALDALTSSLSDQDDRVRLAAAKRLAARAADPEQVWSALSRAPDAGRGEIIASFEKVRSGSLTQIALERLRSPEQAERILAVEVCGWGASPGCVEGAIQALLDPAALVRRTATVSLGRLRDPAAANALGKALGDPDPEVRIGVVRALGVIDDEAVLGFLVSALNDPDHRVRNVTSKVLTEWSSPAVARRLAGVLAVPRLREAATDLLTRIGPPAVELLIDVLMQHNPAVAPTVGDLLQRISQPEEFLSRLEAVEPERRLRGLEALGAIGGPAAADALRRSVSDPDERIRARSAQLLSELDDPLSRDALTGLLRDPIPGVVAAAQDALARLG